MFCLTHPEHHRGDHHRMLRSFKSLKSLRSTESQSHHHHQLTHHQRNPSNASSLTRSSMESSPSRPSTSTTRTDRSTVDWDPLRLHPPLATSHLPFPPTSSTQLGEARHYQDKMRQARPVQDLGSSHHQPLHQRRRNAPAGPAGTVIYDGFDFGFEKPSTNNLTPSAWGPPSPAPSTDGGSSISSYYFGSDGDDESATAALTTPVPRAGPERRGDAVTPRARPAGMDDTDYFIKRGGWKRKGIVFASDVPAAQEEECFDLDMEC